MGSSIAFRTYSVNKNLIMSLVAVTSQRLTSTLSIIRVGTKLYSF